MKPRIVFLLVFISAVIYRFLLNFSVPLVPGIGGGYTIIQVREILEEGRLAVPDMPLVFYFNAFIVKLITLLFPNADVNTLIIHVVKSFDSICFPLMLYPLYKIQKSVFGFGYSRLFLLSVSLFAVLSYSPIELLSDAIKNSVGLMFITFVVFYFLKFTRSRVLKDLLWSLALLALTCLAHFGSFMVALAFLLTGLVVVYRRRAMLPLLVTGLVGVLVVAVFDTQRALSMVTFWKDAFTVFISPRNLVYLQGIFNYISSFYLIILLFRILRKKKQELTRGHQQIILILLIVIIILTFPFYKFEFGRRLGFFLFLFQSVALLTIYPSITRLHKQVITYFVLVLVGFTATFKLIHPKPVAITQSSYADLRRIDSKIIDPEKTIIFCRHGLEWWVAWEHHVNIAMPHIEVDNEMMEKYDHIFYLVQKEGENHIYPGTPSPFTEPVPPENCVKVFDSEYFDMYEFGNSGTQ